MIEGQKALEIEPRDSKFSRCPRPGVYGPATADTATTSNGLSTHREQPETNCAQDIAHPHSHRNSDTVDPPAWSELEPELKEAQQLRKRYWRFSIASRSRVSISRLLVDRLFN